ncbi:hypothetical protein E2C01_043914 [Portunus trituberculatus]|uniref:Secreted protein n=1 Tax=Portunus trituberculatus TaxID=210409 RepID=A0A5B7FRJ5_PORTR|nr:hypothetical protein [Portunus trituberculatus]
MRFLMQDALALLVLPQLAKKAGILHLGNVDRQDLFTATHAESHFNGAPKWCTVPCDSTQRLWCFQKAFHCRRIVLSARVHYHLARLSIYSSFHFNHWGRFATASYTAWGTKGFEPVRLETPQTPKHAWFHCTTAALNFQ